jgi:hypothetical protein
MTFTRYLCILEIEKIFVISRHLRTSVRHATPSMIMIARVGNPESVFGGMGGFDKGNPPGRVTDLLRSLSWFP